MLERSHGRRARQQINCSLSSQGSMVSRWARPLGAGAACAALRRRTDARAAARASARASATACMWRRAASSLWASGADGGGPACAPVVIQPRVVFATQCLFVSSFASCSLHPWGGRGCPTRFLKHATLMLQMDIPVLWVERHPSKQDRISHWEQSILDHRHKHQLHIAESLLQQ